MRLVTFVLCFGLLASCAKDSQPTRYPDRPGGECSRTPGKNCPEGSLCHYSVAAACGDAGGTGACFPIPTTCTKDYSPVCGCDGRTYLNICVAHSHGVSPRTKGTCDGENPPSGPVSCGPGGSTAACNTGQFCRFTEGAFCGEVGAPGECSVPPTACTKEWAPVCGCDGKNYSNDCVAHSHSVSIRHRGLCREEGAAAAGGVGASCGTPKAGDCATGLFCGFPQGARCGEGGKPGKCKARPQACTSDYNPVCGCDGNTYSNACSAAATGISVRKTGACPPATE